MCLTPPPSREELLSFIKICLLPAFIIALLALCMIIGRWLF